MGGFIVVFSSPDTVIIYFHLEDSAADTFHRSLASFGAIIVVLMLLFDPFIQQIVVYPDRLKFSDKPATIVRAQNYEARSYEGLPLPSVVDLSMKVPTGREFDQSVLKG